jgi:hypothetical protein
MSKSKWPWEMPGSSVDDVATVRKSGFVLKYVSLNVDSRATIGCDITPDTI